MEQMPKQKRTIDFSGRTFEVDDVNILNQLDIQRGDRVLITTNSGNRYMIRRSESRDGALMISNEKESNFNVFYPLYNQGEAIAEIGKIMECKITNKKTILKMAKSEILIINNKDIC